MAMLVAKTEGSKMPGRKVAGERKMPGRGVARKNAVAAEKSHFLAAQAIC
ncbi:hypothetical protein QG37_07394 [Candidozyma auris]|uniref:Uncharacterized protein n=1 Tax=Candidozyma auris TaxID=498019 RepID=A0A0L0NQ25_CANAR|nr:hypothetical protein QG37_07394 [[Candida] auris]